MSNPKLTLYVMPKFDTQGTYFCLFENCTPGIHLFETKDQMEIKAHLGQRHTFEELKKWGYRKDMLLSMYLGYLIEKGGGVSGEGVNPSYAQIVQQV